MYNDLGKNISVLHRHNIRRFAVALAHYHLNSGEYGPLIFVYENPGRSQEALASHFAMTKGTVAKMLQRFENAGLIRREVNSSDRRAYCVYPTERMEEIYPELLKIRAMSNGLMMSCLTDIEKTAFAMLLKKVAAHILEYDAGGNIE